MTNGDFEEEIYMARVEQMITEVQAPVSPTSAPLITTKETYESSTLAPKLNSSLLFFEGYHLVESPICLKNLLSLLSYCQDNPSLPLSS